MAKRSRAGKAPAKVVRRPVSSGPKGAGRQPVIIWASLAAIILVVAGVIALQQWALEASVPKATGRPGEGTAWGPANAPVKVIDYSNFGCSHCRSFALTTGKQLRSEYESTGKVRFEFRQFKLNEPSANDAANASLCAADQGRFWDYHDLLFGRQGVTADPFARDALKQYATQLGLNRAQFDRCVDTSQHYDVVQRESDSGRSQGVDATPTFFVNDVRLVGDVPYADFKAVLDSAIQASGG